jgi:hypothetical protein
MTLREHLKKQVAPMKTIGTVGMWTFLVASILPLPPIGILGVVGLVAFLFAVVGTIVKVRCPFCSGRLGRQFIFKLKGNMFAPAPSFEACRHCNARFDDEANE